MDTSLAAVPVARILLGMAEGRVSGLLSVHAGPRTVRIVLREGRVYGVEGTAHVLLGDVLRRQLPAEARYFAAQADARSTRAIGSQLVETGAVSAAELRQALCTLHVERLRWLFSHADLRVGVLAPAPSLGTQLRASVALGVAVIDALFRAHEVPLVEGDSAALPMLHARGASFLRELERQHDRVAPRECMATSTRRSRQAALLRALALCAETASPASYSTLLRKRRDIARGGDAAQLLELARPDGGADVRRKLRGFARRLHPDLFACAQPSLASQAHDVLAALTHAADSLLAPAARTSHPRSRAPG